LAIDLISTEKLGLPGKTCVGAYVFNPETEKVEVFRAKFVILGQWRRKQSLLVYHQP
jgi:L-aspartate oxidase